MKYIEVRFAPTLSTQDGLSCEDVIESVLRGLEKGKSETGIDYNVITCAMRHFAPEQNMQLLDSMEKYVGHGVCALDLAGDESKFPNPLFHESLRRQDTERFLLSSILVRLAMWKMSAQPWNTAQPASAMALH